MKKEEKIDGEFELAELVFGKQPKPETKNKILQILALEETFDLKNPPQLNKYSDWKVWEKAVSHLQAPANYENMYIHILKMKGEEILGLVWLKDNFPEEEHTHLQEDFLILEGTCDFITEEGVFSYQKGDLITVPDAKHQVQVTSKNALKFIIQRVKIKQI